MQFIYSKMTLNNKPETWIWKEYVLVKLQRAKIKA